MKMKYFKPTAVLLVICVVISAALALTYRLTYVPPITDPAEIVAAMSADYAEVLPNSAEYELIYRTESYDRLNTGEVVEATKATNGYILTVHSAGQYDSDPIRIMIGVDALGNIAGIKILKISETPGLGMKANSPSWLSQFIGGNSFLLGADGDSTRIDGITSATRSSRAIVNAVNMAMSEYGKIVSEVN